MVWATDELRNKVEKAKTIILKEFQVEFSCKVFYCSKKELFQKIIKEIRDEREDTFQGKQAEYLAVFAIGKYFKSDNTIHLVKGEGDDLFTITHELLHFF